MMYWKLETVSTVVQSNSVHFGHPRAPVPDREASPVKPPSDILTACHHNNASEPYNFLLRQSPAFNHIVFLP